MLDFSSALYLGFEHPSWSLPDWARLSLGKPALIEQMPGSGRVERELAALTGCERVVVATSTLHLFVDLFSTLARERVAIWIDEAAYPIARWAADRAAAAGRRVTCFAHHDAAALREGLRGSRGERPVIVTDGYCPMRGTHAPLAEYASCAAAGKGLVLVDDTQALGIFGRGGGGSMRYFNLHDPGIVVVSSLAKAFGVPMAMLGGARRLIARFQEASEIAAHCSPPSAAAVIAARRALFLNRRAGDELRRRLAALVGRFRRSLPEMLATDGLFPVQGLKLPLRCDAREVFRKLLGLGVRTVLVRDPKDASARITFLFSARHSLGEIDVAVAKVKRALNPCPVEA